MRAKNLRDNDEPFDCIPLAGRVLQSVCAQRQRSFEADNSPVFSPCSFGRCRQGAVVLIHLAVVPEIVTVQDDDERYELRKRLAIRSGGAESEAAERDMELASFYGRCTEHEGLRRVPSDCVRCNGAACIRCGQLFIRRRRAKPAPEKCPACRKATSSSQ